MRDILLFIMDHPIATAVIATIVAGFLMTLIGLIVAYVTAPYVDDDGEWL